MRRVRATLPKNQLLLHGRCDSDITVNRENCAQCLLPNIDPSIDLLLAQPHVEIPCEVCSDAQDLTKLIMYVWCLQQRLLHLLPRAGPEKVPFRMWLCPAHLAEERSSSQHEQKRA